MKEFVAIDFETANPKRVSACALGYTIVKDGEIVESNGFLTKPIGGHAPFQTKIHGISETETAEQNLIQTAIDQQLGLLLPSLPKFQKVLSAIADERAAAQLAAHERVRFFAEHSPADFSANGIREFFRKWRARQDSNLRPSA